MELAFKFIYVGTIRVEPVPHEAGRFWVGDTPDLVDLADQCGIGGCGCPDMAYNRPKLCEAAVGEIPEDADRYRCKHVKAARVAFGLFLVDQTLALMLKTRTTS